MMETMIAPQVRMRLQTMREKKEEKEKKEKEAIKKERKAQIKIK